MIQTVLKQFLFLLLTCKSVSAGEKNVWTKTALHIWRAASYITLHASVVISENKKNQSNICFTFLWINTHSHPHSEARPRLLYTHMFLCACLHWLSKSKVWSHPHCLSGSVRSCCLRQSWSPSVWFVFIGEGISDGTKAVFVTESCICASACVSLGDKIRYKQERTKKESQSGFLVSPYAACWVM